MSATDELLVGTFIPPAAAITSATTDGSLPVGKIPDTAHARMINLLENLPNARFVHDLDIRATYIRDDQVIYGDFCLNDLDVYVWYAEMDRSVSSYDLDALKTLSLSATVVPDPSRFEIGLDKYQSHLRLRRSGVSVPEMMLIKRDSLASARTALSQWGRALLKPRRGYFGHGVLLVDDFATLRDVIEYSNSIVGGNSDRALLLERYYPNDPEHWVGTTIINGELMYGYRKRASRRVMMKPGSWKVYDPEQQGGDVDLCEVPSTFAEQAYRAQRAFDLPIVGFDLVRFNDTPVIVDENTFPGIYDHLFEQSGKDLGYELYALVLNAIEIHQKKGSQLPNSIHSL